jgi:hypothetical protein
MVKKMKLDFSKVEERSGINTSHMPEGLHAFKIAGVEDREASDGTDMWVFFLVPEAPKYKTRRFPFYCKLQANQYWKVRDLFVAAGVAVPKRAVTLDPTKIVGKVIAGEVIDETGQYEGRSSINGVYGLDILDDAPADDSDDSDDEDEVDEEEVDEEYEDDEAEEEYEDEEEVDYSSMTLAELRKLAKENDIDTAGLKKADLIEELENLDIEDDEDEDEDDEDDLGEEDLEDDEEEDFEDDEEDEEEEEPAPARRRPAAKKPAAAPARKPAAKPAVKRTVKRSR